ncbi:MAG: hypothetical protein U0360_06295 [Dehalococcoidia bacterium]
MTTPPAGGWRSRVHDVQIEAARLAGVATDAARDLASATWAWLAEHIPPLLDRRARTP